MEQEYKEINKMVQEQEPNLVETASESLLANLPILILGLVIFLAVAREIIV